MIAHKFVEWQTYYIKFEDEKRHDDLVQVVSEYIPSEKVCAICSWKRHHPIHH